MMNSVMKRFFEGALTGDVAELRQAISDGADVRAAKDNAVGETALHDAATMGHPAIVSTLIKFDADVNARDQNGCTPLAYAANSTVVQLLVKAGSDINARNNWGETPIMHAALDGNAATVKTMLECGAEINWASDHGWTAILFAARSGLQEVLLKFLDLGAKVPALSQVDDTLNRVLYGHGGRETFQCALETTECSIILLSAMGLSTADLRSMIDPTRGSAAVIAVAQLEARMLPKIREVKEAVYVNV